MFLYIFSFYFCILDFFAKLVLSFPIKNKITYLITLFEKGLIFSYFLNVDIQNKY